MKRKVSQSRSKDGFRYPVLRLPRQFEWLIGREVEIELRDVDGRRALVIYVEDEKNPGVVQFSGNNEKLLQSISDFEGLKRYVEGLGNEYSS
ncbi:hypothetical protein [Thermococcus piezophilus]|uniref:Uncharacterized protein n=1 Tax=Thermococcus piezophilus TaxID=1712654 RepID=A0A172WJ50_9EURY|nr:hypothetical protein [Thermococcus piezophilus]ANF23315.1 hypothetical protein A7C91_09135 [Thermococcus piezophilus]